MTEAIRQQQATVTLLTDQLQKPGSESKKWVMTKVALIGIAVFTFMGAIIILMKPEAGQHAVNLITISTAAWTASTAAYVGAQAAVDARTTSALTTLNTSPPTTA